MFREWKLYNSYLYDRLLTIYDGMYCCDVVLVILAGLRTSNSYLQLLVIVVLPASDGGVYWSTLIGGGSISWHARSGRVGLWRHVQCAI